MNWQLVLLLNLTILVIARFTIKLVADKLPNAKAIFLQYLFCACFVVLYWLFFDKSRIYAEDFLIVGMVGIVNAWGTYCQWRAIKINLSKTSLFNPLSDVLTVILAVLILNEIASWNLLFGSGIVLCFVAVWLFSSQKTESNNNAKNWLLFTAGMVLIFGITTFLMKVFSSTAEIPSTQFLMFWYIGAFAGSIPVFYFEKNNKVNQSERKWILLIPFVSLVILGSLATSYWMFRLTEASRVVPFQSMGGAFLPILIGWFIFKERKGLSKKEIVAFLVGLIGAIFIIFSK